MVPASRLSTGNVTSRPDADLLRLLSTTRARAARTGASVTDPIPADITFDSWERHGDPATASGGRPSGTWQHLKHRFVPAGSSITYVITGTGSEVL